MNSSTQELVSNLEEDIYNCQDGLTFGYLSSLNSLINILQKEYGFSLMFVRERVEKIIPKSLHYVLLLKEKERLKVFDIMEAASRPKKEWKWGGRVLVR